MRSETAYPPTENCCEAFERLLNSNGLSRTRRNTFANPKTWENFLQTNRAQLKELASEEFDASFPNKFKKSIEVNKSEFIRLVRENWEESQKGD